jgi:hypothetical protein
MQELSSFSNRLGIQIIEPVIEPAGGLDPGKEMKFVTGAHYRETRGQFAKVPAYQLCVGVLHGK